MRGCVQNIGGLGEINKRIGGPLDVSSWGALTLDRIPEGPISGKPEHKNMTTNKDRSRFEISQSER